MQNIVLVGFMGTGKSVVGRLLAKKFDRDFVELDELIEKKEGMPIADIFEKKGEPYFRKVEKEVVKEARQLKNVVISVGGGAIVDEENFKNLKSCGTIICLKASADVILKRTKDMKTRPLLNVADPKKRVEDLLSKRQPYYNKADFTIDTDSLTVERVAEEIIKILT